MKIGIFGGAFDPIHRGHEDICAHIVSEFGLDRLIIVPSYNPPHKKLSGTGFFKRLELIKAAFAGNHAVEISDMEYCDGSCRFTSALLERIAGKNPGSRLYYILGSDSLEALDSWKSPEKILSFAAIIAIRRTGFPPESARERLLREFGGNIYISDMENMDMSSSRARALLWLGADARGLISERVLGKIAEEGMYGDFRGITAFVRRVTGAELFSHIERTVAAAVSYNEHIGLSGEEVFLAALLHDVSKRMRFIPVGETGKAQEDLTAYRADQEQAASLKEDTACLEYYEKLKNSEYIAPRGASGSVLHQFTGAEISEKVLGIKNTEILDAIRYHTTGKAGMTKLGKLIYIADKTESDRDYEGVEALRVTAYSDIDRAFLDSLSLSLEHLKKKDAEIYYLTRQALDYYLHTGGESV